MDRWIVALLVGLLGGAGGALAVHLLLPPRVAGGEAPEGDGALAAQLARLETSLAEMRARGPALEAAAPARSAAGAEVAAALEQGGLTTLRGLLREELGAVLDQRMEKLKEASLAAAAKPAAKAPEKKRVALAEAARDMQLSAAEEESLRRIYTDSQERMMRLAAGPGGDVEAVRREVEEARRDPKKRNGLLFKYMPKMLPQIGEVIQITMEQEAAVAEAVGPDKAARLQNEYDLIEANPLGVGGEMRVDARTDPR